jgi:RNA polymerase sigma factor (sigma-70 family)
MEPARANPAGVVERLVREHVRLASFVVNRYLCRYSVGGMEREDLMSWALIGLVCAARAWTPARGVTFSTLACKVMHRSISQGVRREWRPDEAQRTLSLDAPGHDDTDRCLGETLAAAQGGDPEMSLAVRVAVARLSRTDQQLIRRRYYEGYTLRELAGEMKLSPMGVLGRERMALRRLHRALCSGPEPRDRGR